MKVLISEKLSEHKYKTPEGYLICTDAILARTGKQSYTKDELFQDGDNTEVNVDRPYDEVMNAKTIASFENKPITFDHPDEDVNVGNYKDYAIGYVRDVHQGKTDKGEDVILGNLVITDQDAINAIEQGDHTDLSCGYDCDIRDDGNGNYSQTNIRGNHLALCEQGRAGIAHIVDSKINDSLSHADIEQIEKAIRAHLHYVPGALTSKHIEYVLFAYTDLPAEKIKEFVRGHGIRSIKEMGWLDSKVEDVNYSEKEIKEAAMKLLKQKPFLTYEEALQKVKENIRNGNYLLDNKIEDSKLNYDTLKEIKSDIYYAMKGYWQTVFSDEWFDENAFSLEQDYHDEKLLILRFKIRKEAYFRTETDFEKFKERLTTIHDLKLKKIHKKSVKVRYYDNAKFTQVDEITFQYIGQMTDSMRDDYSIKEIEDAGWKTTKMASGIIHELGNMRIIEEENEKGDIQYRIGGTNGQVFSSLEKAKNAIRRKHLDEIEDNMNYSEEMKAVRNALRHIVVDNKSEMKQLIQDLIDNKPMNYSLEVRRLKRAIDELIKWSDNRQEGIDTIWAIAKENRIVDSKVEDNMNDTKDSKEMTMSDAIKMLNIVDIYKKVRDSYIVVRNKSKYEDAARKLGLTIEKDNKSLRIYGDKYKLKQLQNQFDNDEEISYVVIKDASKDKWVIKNTGLAYEIWNQGKMVKKFPTKKLAIEWIHSRFPTDEIIEDSTKDGRLWQTLTRKAKH